MSTPAMRTLDPIPSTRSSVTVDVVTDLPGADEVGAVAVPVAEGAEPPADLGQDAAALGAAGFTGKRGQTIVIPSGGRALVAVGIGAVDNVDEAAVRDLAATFARAVPLHTRLAVELPDREIGVSPADFARAATEGVLLARWRFRISETDDEPVLERLVLIAPAEHSEAVVEGVRRGEVLARAAAVGRDLANCPAAALTACVCCAGSRSGTVATRTVGPWSPC